MADDLDDLPLERYEKAWKRYERKDRSRVMRAVNRMRPLEDPAEAALAIVFARRQRRMWTRWWWAYALLPALVGIPRGWEQVLISGAVGGLLAAGIAAAFAWRAGRSIEVNAEVVRAAQRKRRSGSPRKRAQAGGAGGAGGAGTASRAGRGTRGPKRRGGR
jgi:hypothetical protein